MKIFRRLRERLFPSRTPIQKARGGHVITSEAEELASALFKQIEQLRTYKRATMTQLVFPTTEQEKAALTEAARQYDKECPGYPLVAHGTEHAFSLCQVMLDQELKHSISAGLGSYGNLAFPGYYQDNGWGLFIAKGSTIQELARTPRWTVPLSRIEAILFPSEIVPIVHEFFPEQRNRIKGYRQFAYEIIDSL